MEKGIIIENISNKFKVKVNENVFVCDARGKLKKVYLKPVVGDYVNIEITNYELKLGVIEEILERKNCFKRPRMANIDQLIFVISTKNPRPDLLMLDKQLVLAEFININPIIIINKIDLDEKMAKIIEAQYRATGYKIIKTVAKNEIGIDEIKNQLKYKISAFSGNSGVGKSTIINSLFQERINEEGEVSNKNKRGKNTTTSVSLHMLDNDTFIADTPGFSNFDINEICSEELANYFVEFKNYIKECEFAGCTHIKEENCGIKKAVDDNIISKERYERFVKIYEILKDREEHKW